MTDTATHRKTFALGLSIIATAITMASAAATYSINVESFSDWGSYTSRVLAILATAGIELTFCWLLYGVSNAITGTVEKAISIFGLAFLLIVMATNYTIHRQTVKGIPLSSWQVSYYEWIGSLVLFAIVALIIGLKMGSHEARTRRLQRDIEHLALEQGLKHKKEMLESSDLQDFLGQFQPEIFEDVKRAIKIPTRRYLGAPATATAEDDKKIGFAKYRGADPKA